MVKRPAVAIAAAAILLLYTVVASAQDSSPALIGKWAGSWTGNMSHPVEIVITGQDGSKVSGSVIIVWRGRQTYRISKGTISGTGDHVKLVIKFEMEGHPDTFTFTAVTQEEMSGQGRGMRHKGPVTLTRISTKTAS